MESIVEFALYTWVVVSILAVLIQLVRIARYRRAKSGPTVETIAPSTASTDTVDLEGRRAAPPDPAERPDPGEIEQLATTMAPSLQSVGASEPPTQPAPPPAPAADPSPSAGIESSATDSNADHSASPIDEVEVVTAQETGNDALAAPALADLLAGVRLPWNLLPTVDRSRAPSTDRVVLITDEGEPSAIGSDVADELERLGFSISTQGDDTAFAERDGHSLGLQIIPEPMGARVGDTPRFPSATPESVALDIWINF